MSDTANHTPSRGPLITLGALAAFASFAVIAAILQAYAGGKPADPLSEVRLKNKAEIAEAQLALLKKSGLADNPDAVIAKALGSIAARKPETSKVVVPGSATAIKQSAPAPVAPAPAPVTPAPAPVAPAPAPVAPAPAPVAPAPAPVTPAPAPVPATPPPAPPVPGAPSN
jgi:hypothetical protein